MILSLWFACVAPFVEPSPPPEDLPMSRAALAADPPPGTSLVVESPTASTSDPGLPRCPVRVEIRSQAGEPVPNALVHWRSRPGRLVAGVAGRTGASGNLGLVIPCGPVSLVATAPGMAPVREVTGTPHEVRRSCDLADWEAGACLDRGEGAPLITLVMGPGAAVEGRVRGPTGDPVSAAQVELLGGSAHGGGAFWPAVPTDPEGHYALWVPMSEEADALELRARAEGFSDGRAELVLHGTAARGVVSELDLELGAARTLDLACAGLEAEACKGVEARCGPEEDGPGRATRCDAWGRCTCPDVGGLALWGGGVATRIGAQAEIAWLDLRGVHGEISAHTVDGGPCLASLLRPSPVLSELFGRSTALRMARCDGEGQLHFTAVPDGPWRLQIRREGEVDRPAQQLDVEIGGAALDLGPLDLGG